MRRPRRPPTVARRGRAANAGVVATRLESSQGRAMLSKLSTVFARTAEDEVIDEDKKTRLMERRLARGTAHGLSPAEAGSMI